jgi:putative flippase GtrA
MACGRFGIGPGAFSPRRLALYVIVLTLVLTGRIAGVAVLAWLIGDPKGYELAILSAATAVSFVVNYLLSKYVVFRESSSPTAAQWTGPWIMSS